MENNENQKSIDPTPIIIRFSGFDWIILVGAMVILPGAIMSLVADITFLFLSDSVEKLPKLVADIVWLGISGWVLKIKLKKFKEIKTLKSYKIIFITTWIVVALILIPTFFLIYSAFNQVKTTNTTLQAEQASIPGFVKYSGQEAGFNFSVLFPTSNPESFDLNLDVVYIKSFQAPHIIDLEQSKFVQYSVFFSTPTAGKILSNESIRVYLENFPKGKSIPSGGTLTREEIITYKGLMAIEYVFSSEMQGVLMTHKGIAFVVDGIPIDLSVVYTNVTPLSSVYYDDYIKSFAISAN